MKLSQVKYQPWLHGSNNPNLKELRIGEGGEDIYGKGIYLTDSEKYARTYGKYIYHVQVTPNLNIANFDDRLTVSHIDKLEEMFKNQGVQRQGDTLFLKRGHVSAGDDMMKAHNNLKQNFGKTHVNRIFQELKYDALLFLGAGFPKFHIHVIFDEKNTKII